MAGVPTPALLARGAALYLRKARRRSTMLEMYFMLQLARSPLQVMAKRLMCKSLSVATHGRRQCRGCGATSRDAD
ncbi:hypothetical protein [Rhodopseudomonas palustris]|uniref:hypothetical protein n=1 Tax=Rhodopseudomonas palustris TaxID=1076 RepID=UPI0020CEF65E|nr:hypothetical protein [Rhodopseudomonas palustris]